MPSGNACYKAKGATARIRMASKTHMPRGKAACSRAATHQASKVVTNKVATINEAEVMDSKAQEAVMARQVSKVDTTAVTVSKEVALLGEPDSMAML